MSGASGADRPFEVDARGMRCPWPVLRAARAMREHEAVLLHADDPIAGQEAKALAGERGWRFCEVETHLYLLSSGSALR
jgi:tRNA 2-thiouridine synthesizing protein A